MPADVQQIVANNKLLISRDANWLSYAQDVADFCLPRKAWITSVKAKGDRLKFNFLYDSTAERSLQVLSAGFHSNLTNPSSKWFGMETEDKNLMESRDIRMWLYDTEERMFRALHESNFDTSMQEFYIDYGCFGTATMIELEDIKNIFRFTVIPFEQTYFSEDSNGRVVEVHRNFKYTAQQAYMLWGENAGKSVLEKYKHHPYDELDFIHYVGPRDIREAGKMDSINMPWMSVWINVVDEVICDEKGFQENPYVVGRFYKEANDVRGVSPAMQVLADIKLINAQKRTMLRSAMKQSDPPLSLPSKGYVLPLNLNPGAINYRDKDVPHDSIQQLPVGSNFPITKDVIEMTKNDIQEGFFVPVFRALADITKEMTVPEVQHRVAENMVMLGPVVGRAIHEILTPILSRTFRIMYRAGKLLPAPEAIKKTNLNFVYLSMLAKAQRQSEQNSLNSFLMTSAQVAQVKPEVLDKINGDRFIDVLARINAITPEIFNSDNEIKNIRDQKEKQQQMAMALQAAQQTADIAKTSADADHKKAKAGEVKK